MCRKPAFVREAMQVFWKAGMFGRVRKGICCRSKYPFGSNDKKRSLITLMMSISARLQSTHVGRRVTASYCKPFYMFILKHYTLSSHVISPTFDSLTGVSIRVLGPAVSQGSLFFVRILRILHALMHL